jgi:Ca-activated chloride channel family protein
MKRFLIPIAGLVALALLALLGLGLIAAPPVPLTIVAGSENKTLEPLMQDWAKRNNVALTVTYLGSVDIARALEQGKSGAYDAVWPANSLWIALGDTQKVVKHASSILRSPVVLALKKPIAVQLGWVGRQDITIQMIADAAKAQKFRLAMTSATQSNSGASAYFGFLYALSGSPDVLTMDNLRDPKVLDDVRNLLAQVDRSSGSSGWLKDSLVANPAAYDAMFNYESTVIEANQALVAAGQDPLYIIYPANGLSVADSPLGYIDKGDATREAAFVKLQEFLLSSATQQTLSDLGRRSGLIGIEAQSPNPAVWNADWGADLSRQIAPVPTPATDVIAEALSLYQTELRKPSLTVWVLDVSGSMGGDPILKLKQAMGLLLDKRQAAVNLLQPSQRDVTIIIPFSDTIGQPIIVKGNAEADLAAALAQVDALQAGGGTDLYGALGEAINTLQPYKDDGTLLTYLPAIVAMTDGASDMMNFDYFNQTRDQSSFGKDIPIHAIAFGEADMSQLTALTDTSIGRLFIAGDDLAGALRQAKGYN